MIIFIIIPDILCNKPIIPNGSVSPSNATIEYGQTYNVTCDNGFGINGATTITCGADEDFDKTPSCEGPCSKPVIPNGRVIPSNSTIEYGQTYNVTCDNGFGINEATTITCGADEDFDQTPTCEGPCNKPAIPNGSVSPSDATIDYGQTYNVNCDTG